MSLEKAGEDGVGLRVFRDGHAHLGFEICPTCINGSDLVSVQVLRSIREEGLLLVVGVWSLLTSGVGGRSGADCFGDKVLDLAGVLIVWRAAGRPFLCGGVRAACSAGVVF